MLLAIDVQSHSEPEGWVFAQMDVQKRMDRTHYLSIFWDIDESMLFYLPDLAAALCIAIRLRDKFADDVMMT